MIRFVFFASMTMVAGCAHQAGMSDVSTQADQPQKKWELTKQSTGSIGGIVCQYAKGDQYRYIKLPAGKRCSETYEFPE